MKPVVPILTLIRTARCNNDNNDNNSNNSNDDNNVHDTANQDVMLSVSRGGFCKPHQTKPNI